MKTYNEIKLAQELIRFPTIKTEDRGIMKFLSRKLLAIGFKYTIIKSKGTGSKPALNLYAKFGNSKPHINFLGHTDVVANLNNWKIPPFKAVVKNGYLNECPFFIQIHLNIFLHLVLPCILNRLLLQLVYRQNLEHLH